MRNLPAAAKPDSVYLGPVGGFSGKILNAPGISRPPKTKRERDKESKTERTK